MVEHFITLLLQLQGTIIIVKLDTIFLTLVLRSNNTSRFESVQFNFYVYVLNIHKTHFVILFSNFKLCLNLRIL